MGLPAKQLELARELVPGATRVGLVNDIADPKAYPQRQEIVAAGKSSDVTIVLADVRTAADIGPAYGALAAAGVEIVSGGGEQHAALLHARSSPNKRTLKKAA